MPMSVQCPILGRRAGTGEILGKGVQQVPPAAASAVNSARFGYQGDYDVDGTTELSLRDGDDDSDDDLVILI